MANQDESIVMSSANCRGLGDRKKRIDVLDYLKNTKSNIVCLQDTHWLTSEERNIRKIWDNPCYLNGIKSNARGVAILIKNNFEYSVQDKIIDQNGNMIVLDITLSNEFSIRLINIYAPNDDNPEFFQHIDHLITTSNCDYSIICGDFNLTLNPDLDSKNYININNPRSRTSLLKSMNNLNLVDTFRHLHPLNKKYTWSRKTPKKYARLDYFISSGPLLDLISDSKIKPGYRSDHSRIELKIVINSFTKGPGLWKFNCSLLKDPKYIALVNETIDKEKLKYAVPVYNHDSIPNINDEFLHLTINDNLFLEMLLLSIRGETIKYSSHVKKKTREREKTLIQDIENLETNHALENTGDILQDKKNELVEIRNQFLKGQMVRSRVQYLDEGERPTKYFSALETKNYVNKTVKKIKSEGPGFITDQIQILDEIKKFYQNLFQNKDNETNSLELDRTLSNLKSTKLSLAISNSIEGSLTI